jgi:hypothetical protein
MSVGTGVSQPPAQLVATAQAVLAKIPEDILGDEVLTPSPLLWAFTRKGKIGGGSASIVYGALSAKNMNNGAYFGDMLLNNQVVDVVQAVEQQWRFNYQAVTIPITDLVLQSGSGMDGIRDIVKQQLTIAAGSFTDYLSRAEWHIAPANSALDVDDLDSWVGQTANTIGGISRSANSWWQPQAPRPVQNPGTLALFDAEAAYQLLGFGNDFPDIMAMRPLVYAQFKTNFTNQIRYIDNDKVLDGSIPEHFLFNRMVVLSDRFTPDTDAYIFNSRYIYPKFHVADYFTLDPWLKPSRQRTVTTMMYLTWQIICPVPNLAGLKLTGCASSPGPR